MSNNMSLDLWLESPVCPACGQKYFEIINHNYTYNVSIMWYEMFPDATEMVDIDGLTGKEACYKLIKAQEIMGKNRAHLITLEPSNNWGSFDGFYKFINYLIQDCLEHPDWIWRSFR
jgi:hypothetical protein